MPDRRTANIDMHQVTRSPGAPAVGLLGEAGDAERLEQVLFPDRLGIAVFHLAQEIFFERHFQEMHPFAFFHPVEIARRNLGQGDERDAVVPHVGQAHRIPGGLRHGGLPGKLSWLIANAILVPSGDQAGSRFHAVAVLWVRRVGFEPSPFIV